MFQWPIGVRSGYSMALSLVASDPVAVGATHGVDAEGFLALVLVLG
jgi:hypothetical protein